MTTTTRNAVLGLLMLPAVAALASIWPDGERHQSTQLDKDIANQAMIIPNADVFGDKAAKPGANGASLDTSGQTRVGKGSYYGKGFIGKKMADGRPMNPHAHAAASKTLPLGTIAKVTNLHNGKSVLVQITDRGPYVKGRIVDVTPLVADKLELTHHGVVPVEVTPVLVALPGGRGKPGAAVHEYGSFRDIALKEAGGSGD